MAINKTQAIHILAAQSQEASFMANVIQCQSFYKGKAAKYLKCMATLAIHGFNVRLAPFSTTAPVVDGKQVAWGTVEVIGTALYKGGITAEQARMLVREVEGEQLFPPSLP